MIHRLLAGRFSRTAASSLALLFIGLVADATLHAQNAPAAPATAAQWGSREYRDFKLETPFELKPAPDMETGLPSSTNNVVAGIHSAQGGDENQILMVLTEVTYKPNVTLNIEGAIRGAITAMAAKIEDNNPQYAVDTLKVSDLEARHALYQHDLGEGHVVYVEELVALHGQTMYQIQLFTLNGSLRTDMTRILKSIAIVAH
ncbi:MAG: hypothetical protein QM760_18825 [Nibricoccus sp.]